MAADKVLLKGMRAGHCRQKFGNNSAKGSNRPTINFI
jgi:coenzyme F420-reducing hydrogenase delta subunit